MFPYILNGLNADLYCFKLKKNHSINLQEALEDREKQIQALLTERELEQKEVASTSIQVIKVGWEIHPKGILYVGFI